MTWKKLWAWVVGELGAMAAIVKPAVTKLATDAVNAALQIAVQEVAAVVLDPTLVTNDQKRAVEYTNVVAKLKAAGLKVADSDIRLVIEVAVQDWISKYPAGK
jgi:uncharacterized membrane protein YdcZ (DUF606 family)